MAANRMKKFSFVLISAYTALLLVGNAAATETAEDFFAAGLAAQKEKRNEEALRAYQKALGLRPGFGEAHYEIGWTYWVREDWKNVVHHWQQAKKLGVNKPDFDSYLQTAQQNLEGKLPPLTRTEIGLRSQPLDSGPNHALVLELAARFQHYNPQPSHAADHYDPYMFSPKSVRFLPDNSKAYVNALEGYSTLVYDPVRLARQAVIVHRFKTQQAELFANDRPDQWYTMPESFRAKRNEFNGKPVESALSHQGRYLWVPYYRRDFDPYGTLPSAVAVIDTRLDRIVRVMETGPIPKYVVASPDGKWMAIVHWGDNTVGLINIESDDPANFRHADLVTIGHRIDLNKIQDNDRDHGCGYCLRGSVFSPDSKFLLVGRMGGGGVAVINVAEKKYLGTVNGMRPTPRHMVLSPDGQLLYISSSFAGYVSVFRLNEFIDTVFKPGRFIKPLMEQKTGSATRTIALSPDGKLLFAAVNKESKIVALSTTGLKPLATIETDSYPVGMAVSPDGKQLWVTAQGRERRGGNSVSVYRIISSPVN